jgi:hypothetical protein
MVWLMVATAIISPITVDRMPGESWTLRLLTKSKNVLSGRALLKIVAVVVALMSSFLAPHNWYFILLLVTLLVLIGRARVTYESACRLPANWSSTDRALLVRKYRAITIGGVVAFLLWWAVFATQFQVHDVMPESLRDFLGAGFGAVFGAHNAVAKDAA